jgi:hypothetical protein
MAEIVWNPAAVEAFFNGPAGPVGLSAASRASRVLAGARVTCPVGKAIPGWAAAQLAPRTRAIGTLRDSLRMFPVYSATGPEFFIGSDDPVATYVTRGTRPHPIRAKKAGGRLAFYWAREDRLAFPKEVMHPGTKPNDFLSRALPLAIL